MAGLVLVYDKHRRTSQAEAIFKSLVKATCEFKNIDAPKSVKKRENFFAAKLDKEHSAYPGMIQGPSDDSWIMIMGSVSDSSHPDTSDNLAYLVENFTTSVDKTLETLEGHFVIIFYDQKNKHVWLINDPFGMMSIFYAEWNGLLLISSSAMAIARVASFTGNRNMAEFFLYTGNLYGQQTLWQGIHRLGPASLWNLSSSQDSPRRYWTAQPDMRIHKMSLQENLEMAHRSSSEAVRLAFQDKKERCCLNLPAGMDSRLLSLLMSENKIFFRCVCHGSKSDHPDVKFSRRLARIMNWEYHFQEFPSDWTRLAELYAISLGFADGYLDPFIVALTTWLNQGKLRDDNLIVSGGAGEFLRAYPLHRRQRIDLDSSRSPQYFRLFKDFFLKPVDESVLREPNPSEVEARTLTHYKTLAEEFLDESAAQKLDRIYLEKMIGHNGAFISSVQPTNLTIHPFYNRSFIQLALSLPYRLKRNNRFARHLIHKLDAKAANVQTDKGYLAGPVSFSNFHLAALAKAEFILRKLDQKLSPYLFKKTLLTDAFKQPKNYACYFSLYPLQPSRMATASLYNTDKLVEVMNASLHRDYPHKEFLSRIIALERAFETTDTDLS